MFAACISCMRESAGLQLVQYQADLKENFDLLCMKQLDR